MKTHNGRGRQIWRRSSASPSTGRLRALRRGPASPRHHLAVALSQAAGALARTAGPGEGHAVGGRVLLAVDPQALSHAATGRRVCLVTGSNGKTTTTRMIVEALTTAGPVCSNATGANMPSGMAAALTASTAGRAVLEVDESYLPAAVRATCPEVVVLTNLSRDQLDRHAEVSAIARRWRQALTGLPATSVVVANADDPLAVWAALGAPRATWVAAGATGTSDASICPDCGGLLRAASGDWSCSSCSMRRPAPTWQLQGQCLVDPAGQLHVLTLGLPGRANAADAALATAAAHQFAIPTPDALAALSGIRSVQGRYSVHRVAGREIQLILAKNPASWMEQLDDMAAGSDPIVIASHGRGADGRDLSWLWDVDFERLRGRPVAVIGERQLDMAVRLSTAGIEPLLATDLAAAVRLLPAASRVRVIASYTALQDLRRQLSRPDVR